MRLERLVGRRDSDFHFEVPSVRKIPCFPKFFLPLGIDSECMPE